MELYRWARRGGWKVSRARGRIDYLPCGCSGWWLPFGRAPLPGRRKERGMGKKKEREGGGTDVRGQQRSERKKTRAVWLIGGPALERGE